MKRKRFSKSSNGNSSPEVKHYYLHMIFSRSVLQIQCLFLAVFGYYIPKCQKSRLSWAWVNCCTGHKLHVHVDYTRYVSFPAALRLVRQAEPQTGGEVVEAVETVGARRSRRREDSPCAAGCVGFWGLGDPFCTVTLFLDCGWHVVDCVSHKIFRKLH